MNARIGSISAIVNAAFVIGFALFMALGLDAASYLICMFIAFSFVPLISAFAQEAAADRKAAGYAALGFAGIYAGIILLVYFAQVTAVQQDGLNEQALQLLDYQQFGLFFSFDLLGYGLMALSTFFAGLALAPQNRADRWLKGLLLFHGIFFLPCLILPMLGIFSADLGNIDWIGTAILQVWCIYFTPVGVLAWMHFRKPCAGKIKG